MSAADARDLATLDWLGSCAERGATRHGCFAPNYSAPAARSPTMRAPTSAEDWSDGFVEPGVPSIYLLALLGPRLPQRGWLRRSVTATRATKSIPGRSLG